jgi:hypothetical protein
MKTWIKSPLLIAVGAITLIGLGTPAKAAMTFTVDPGATWSGYMNVSNLPANGGAYQFGSSWGTADLTAAFSGPILTLGPNSINDPDPYWYVGGGAPGNPGNKNMFAEFYMDKGGTLAGQDITFTANVLSNTFINPYTTIAYIYDYAPDYSTKVETTVPLTNGIFNLNYTAINDPTRHVLIGFLTVGPNVWVTDRGPVGTAQITAVPEPQEYAVGIAALLGAVILLRRRQQARA